MRETAKRLMSSTAAIPVLFGLALAVPAAAAVTAIDATPAAAARNPRKAAGKARDPCKAARTD